MILHTMQFKMEKWFSSSQVRNMSVEEKAAYLLLLVEAWSSDCFLEKSSLQTIKNAGGIKWKNTIDSVVSRMFLVGNDGRFYNETQLEIFGTILKETEKRSQNGKKSAQIRWEKRCDGNAMAMPMQCDGNANGITSKTKTKAKAITNKEETNVSKKNDDVLFELEETKDSKPKKQKFIPPTLEEVNQFAKYYCEEKKIHNDRDEPQAFLDYWNERNWIDKTKTAVTDWKARYRTWMRNKTKMGAGSTLPIHRKPAENVLYPSQEDLAAAASREEAKIKANENRTDF